MTRRVVFAGLSSGLALVLLVVLAIYTGNASAVFSMALAGALYACGVQLAREAFADEKVPAKTQRVYVYAWPIVMLLCTIADLDGVEEPK